MWLVNLRAATCYSSTGRAIRAVKPSRNGRYFHDRFRTMNADSEVSLQTENGWAILPSSLKRPDGKPRFDLSFPTHYGTDVGAVHLVASEARHGYEPPTRNLIERTLRRGDLFLDVGAHWGFFTLQAASHPAGDVDVVAFEPELMNATILTENVVRNNMADAVTVICAACGDQFGLAPLVTNSTMGHRISGADFRFSGTAPSKWVSIVALDGALKSLQKPLDRRIILKIDAEGFEPNVIAGANALLQAGRVALLIWECGGAFAEPRRRGAMMAMVTFLSDCGFRHFRPPDNYTAGSLTEFDAASEYVGNVFSCGPQLAEELAA
jgi:FkbM family methyltransferase